NVGTIAQATALEDRMDSSPQKGEPDPTVRQAAWEVLAGKDPNVSPPALLRRPEVTAPMLNIWTNRKLIWEDPAKRLVLQKLELAKYNTTIPDEAKSTAGINQNMGETYVLLKQWDDAEKKFKAALD